MCTAEAVPLGGDAFSSPSEALRVAGAAMDYFNSPALIDLDGAVCGELLIGLGELQAKLTAAHSGLLRRFDAVNGHDADGYGSSSAWLASKAGMSKGAAKASVRRMRQLGERPLLGSALAAGDITDSLAFTIAEWTRRLPAGMRTETDRILLEAAAAGASLDDLATIAACAIEKWRQQQPDPDDPDDAFEDRSVRLGTTFGGAGVIRGNLTPECAAAVRAVLEALGKKAGPEDDRTEEKRFHDALQLACELLLRARLVPDRAGADTQVIAHIPLSQLRQLPGAGDIEDAWIRARLGEDGYLAGKDAEAAACDAQTVPVVTGTMDPDVIDQIIDLARTAAEASPPDDPAGASCDPAANGTRAEAVDTPGSGGGASGGETAESGQAGRPSPARSGPETGTAREAAAPGPANTGPVNTGPEGKGAGQAGPRPAGSSPEGETAGQAAPGLSRPPHLSPEAWRALRSAIARLAIDLVSGPAGIAATLRQGLLDKPYNTPSLPLDIGYSRSIPWHIRRAVLLRDRTCAWPRCDRPAAHCDVHHLRHQRDGGETSVENCVLACQYHHDVCIHRRGWRLIMHPDGTTEARSPDDKKILHGHAPPAEQAALPAGTRPARSAPLDRHR